MRAEDLAGAIEQDLAGAIEQDLSRYGRAQRLLEVCGIGLFSLLVAVNSIQIEKTQAWVLAVLALAAWLAADLLSGMAHWAFDTWGSVRTPLLGPAFIRPFREHHVDPEAMARHDFIETNGSSCLGCVPLLAAALVLPADSLPRAFLVCLSLAVLATNQCHKWAHMKLQQVPALVRLAQRWRLVLEPAQHRLHHAQPFDTRYCMSSGWLNAPLDRLGFFRGLERAVRALARSLRAT